MKRNAFTLTELLVVISIIAFIVGATSLAYGPVKRMVNETNDANALQGAVSFARSSAVQTWTGIPPYTFDGAAAVIMPDRFRVLISDPNSDQFVSYLEPIGDLEQFGFRHQDFQRSDDLLIYGIHRDASSPDAQLIEPPFAVWFDPNGVLKIGVIIAEDETNPAGVAVRSVIGVVTVKSRGADLSSMPSAHDVLADNPTAQSILFGKYGEAIRSER